MTKSKIACSIGTAALLFLSGCQQPGQDLAANVYQAGQVNQQQAVKTVTILSVLPAKVEVDNRANQRTAQVAGALFGAIAGGLIGNAVGRPYSGATLLGTSAGGVAGLAAGSAVSSTALVDGVTIAYENSVHHLFSSTQVGKLCQFKSGTAILVSTGHGETRLQPNAFCPKVGNAT